MIIAVDGPTASGKGTIAKQLAAHFDLPLMDTGLLYRAVGKQLHDNGGDADNADDALIAYAFDDKILDDERLRHEDIGALASRVSVHSDVRDALFERQRAFAYQRGGAVLDGRDIGTVICPDAEIKLFVDAEATERARRRHLELMGYGEDITYEMVLAQLKERDARDSGRDIAPLKPAENAHLLDTTNLSIERAFEIAIAMCEAILTTKPV